MAARDGARIARQRSIWQIRGTPVGSVLLASMLPALPFVAQTPILPPLGLMVFIAWRMLRPDIWPLWVGLPFGLFDDVMSGMPIGSAVFLWTAILLGLEIQSRRVVWHDYWHDWLFGALALIFAILGGWAILRLSGTGGSPVLLLPQIVYSLGLFPLVVRLCAHLDRWRLP